MNSAMKTVVQASPVEKTIKQMSLAEIDNELLIIQKRGRVLRVVERKLIEQDMKDRRRSTALVAAREAVLFRRACPDSSTAAATQRT